MLEYFDKDGTPILDMLEWARLFGDHEYKRIAATQIGPWWISTVWLGLNHNYLGAGPPLIFETMVFWHGPGPARETDYEYQMRYETLQQARDGHARVIRAYRKQLRAMPKLSADLKL